MHIHRNDSLEENSALSNTVDRRQEHEGRLFYRDSQGSEVSLKRGWQCPVRQRPDKRKPCNGNREIDAVTLLACAQTETWSSGIKEAAGAEAARGRNVRAARRRCICWLRGSTDRVRCKPSLQRLPVARTVPRYFLLDLRIECIHKISGSSNPLDLVRSCLAKVCTASLTRGYTARRAQPTNQEMTAASGRLRWHDVSDSRPEYRQPNCKRSLRLTTTVRKVASITHTYRRWYVLRVELFCGGPWNFHRSNTFLFYRRSRYQSAIIRILLSIVRHRLFNDLHFVRDR